MVDETGFFALPAKLGIRPDQPVSPIIGARQRVIQKKGVLFKHLNIQEWFSREKFQLLQKKSPILCPDLESGMALLETRLFHS
jgi:hypothetical protein